MRLTKLEKAIAFATILNAVGEESIEEYAELETLRPVAKELNKLNKKIKPEEKKKAVKSLINKMRDDFTKAIKKENPPIQK